MLPAHHATRRLGRYSKTLWQRVEIWTLIGALVAAAAIWAFVSIAGEVVEGDTKGLDREILLSLRSASDPSDPIGPRWLEELGRDVTALGGTGILIMITTFVALYLWIAGKRRSMVMVVAAIASGFLASQILKRSFARPRPDLVPHGDYVYTASFPSGHAMMSAITYLTLAILLARVEPRRRMRAFLIGLAVFLTVIIGVSRVYLGVHWPSDVLAGWTAGAAWALMWWLLATWLESRGAVEPSPQNVATPEGIGHAEPDERGARD
ncbi:phosphatase PAP2 family protein [Jiella sp. MQZ9-1]|uniref:Phosphatase PAP2 family protein n=1 Tax=Jiella flava TaxID=2816857 RepID=A0A939FVY4_9HYPH|nr:phosphatase PAP2 family protein [Jiella flava]MBO0661165.1 phosphatase PAP2 family protein [Jiella flava]MCD2469810.1 phosphatase PAP2 family protein [Jiella flava]